MSISEETVRSLITDLEKKDKEIKRKSFVIEYLIELLQLIVSRYNVSYIDLIEFAATTLRKTSK